MSFFDKLTKKTNEAYQTAKEKTVKISEEIKLKSKISDLKDSINEVKDEYDFILISMLEPRFYVFIIQHCECFYQ